MASTASHTAPAPVRFIPLSYNNADSQASALRLVLSVNPQWEHGEGEIEFIRFTDGITNTLLKIIRKVPGYTDEQIDNEAVLMRAYGNNTEILIDRAREADSHALLASRGLAPPLLARFKNGLLYRFIRGRATTPDDLTREAVWRGVARRLGQWHAVLPINIDHAVPTSHTDQSVLDNLHPKAEGRSASTTTEPQDVRIHGPNLWTVMEKWIAALPNTTEEQKTRQQTLAAECARVRSELDTKTGLGESGLVFSHCDLLSANCIIQPRTETADPNIEDINFIDYEYATPCPAAFDIANHFAEWIGFDCDYNRTPTRKTRRGFLEEYVKSFDQFQSLGSQEERGKVLDQLFDQVDQYRGMPGFYWGVWSLIQAQISQIDFDYASYAEFRLGEYWAWRAEVDGTRVKEGGELGLRETRWGAEE